MSKRVGIVSLFYVATLAWLVPSTVTAATIQVKFAEVATLLGQCITASAKATTKPKPSSVPAVSAVGSATLQPQHPSPLLDECLGANPASPGCVDTACKSLYRSGPKSRFLLYGTEFAQDAYDEVCPNNQLKFGLLRKGAAQNSGWRRNSAILATKPRLLSALRKNLRAIGIERTLSGPLQLTYHLLYRKDPLQISFLLFGNHSPYAEDNYSFRPAKGEKPYKTSEEYLVLYALLSLMEEMAAGDATENNPLSGGGTLKLVYVPEKPKSIRDFKVVSRSEFLERARRSCIGSEARLTAITSKLKDFFRLESARVMRRDTTRFKLHEIPQYRIDANHVYSPDGNNEHNL